MIYFVTNKRNYDTAYNPVLFPDIKVLSETQGLALFQKVLGKKRQLSLDIEATGLDPYLTDILLLGIGDKYNQFMFDYTINLVPYIEFLDKKKRVVLGHNLKYDIKLLKVNTGIMLRRLYDTMIADQRIYMGLGRSNENPDGYEWSLAGVIARRLGKAMLKETRMEFIGADKTTFKITASQLYYLRGDLQDLSAIKNSQKKQIHQYKMQFLIYGIEFPLISVLADAELEGFDFNKEKWLEKLKKNQALAFELQQELDFVFRKIRKEKEFLIKDTIALIKGGKWDNQRVHNSEYDLFNKDGTMNTLDLFGQPASTNAYLKRKAKTLIKVKKNPNDINYASSVHLTQMFAGLQEQVATTDGRYIVPKINAKGKISASQIGASFSEKAILKYIEDKPNSIMNEFLLKLIELGKVEKAISTYGENFITYLNPTTGRLHTEFKQCITSTGRMASGGGKKAADKPNFQNIPRDNDYRNCFTVDTEKYSVITADYSGAELIVMCSHAQDQKLLELSKGDMHSHMATKAWRAIFKKRLKDTEEYLKAVIKVNNQDAIIQTQGIINELKNKVVNFIVDKINPPGFRTGFKGMTFGVIYGMFAKKAGETLKVPKDEGQIVIKVIESEIPATIAMVKEKSIFAEKNGYVIFNKRTNSRAWFPYLIKQLQGKVDKNSSFIDISKDLSAARNASIQGTQADFVKEAGVYLWSYIRKNNLDCKILSFVHDEIVTKVPKYLDGKSEQWKNYIKLHPAGLTSPFNGKSGYSFSQIKEEIMINVANKYLKNVEISVDYHVEEYWLK